MAKTQIGKRNIKFSSELHAIMWISTKGILREHEEKISKIIEKKIGKNKIVFNGFCFGRFDLLVEFTEKSARVASNIVCELQEEIIAKKYPTCSSLSLCTKVYENDGKNRRLLKTPIRTFTFLTPKNREVNLEDVLDIIMELNQKNGPKLELFWTASSHVFLLTVNGNNFHEMFRKILEFREGTEDYFSESCTYVGLGWKGKEKGKEGPMKALTFVKLKSGYGDLKLTQKDLSLGWRKEKMNKRLGGSDISLEISKPTLRGIKEAILSLRKNHEKRGDIAGTSTLLLPQV